MTTPADAINVATEKATKALDNSGARLSRLTNWFLGIYLGAILVIIVVLRINPSIDLFFVLGGLAAILLGRTKAFVRDWGPFLILLLAWEAMHGVANQFGQAVQSDSIISIERFISGGIVPTVVLQQALHHEGQISPLDLMLSVLYMTHFFFPLAAAFVLWINDRARYYRFVATLLVVSFAAFLTYLALPVAPPRFAYQFGEALPVVDIMREVARSIDWQGFSWMYQHLVGNPVAAFPSLHAAYPLLIFLLLRERWPRRALLWLPCMLTIWFAVVYLGHHYVVDVLGGIAYASVGYLAVRTSWAARFGRLYAHALGRLVPRRWRREGVN